MSAGETQAVVGHGETQRVNGHGGRSVRASPMWRQWGSSVGAAVAVLLANMSLGEKSSLLAGVGWDGYQLRPGYYIGSVHAVPSVGLPPINLHDAGQGFRTTDPRMVGQVTSFPCMLGLESEVMLKVGG